MAKFRFDDSAKSLLKAFDAQLLAAARRGSTSKRFVRGRTQLQSSAYGCLPNEVAEANAACKRMNIAAEYQPDGSVRYGGPEAERKHRKAIENAKTGNV